MIACYATGLTDGAPGKEFDDDVELTILVAELVQGRYPRVSQPAGDPRLPPEASARLVLPVQAAASDEVDGDRPVQAPVGALPHQAHAATAERRAEFIPARDNPHDVPSRPSRYAAADSLTIAGQEWTRLTVPGDDQGVPRTGGRNEEERAGAL